MNRTLTVAHSPDADDAFMFHAALAGLVDTEGLAFSAWTDDTEALNQAALRGGSEAPDVCAVSVHAYAYLGDRYLLLPHGGSVGDGYGPVLVASRPDTLAGLVERGAEVGIPGRRTTAALVLALFAPHLRVREVPIVPHTRVFDLLARRELDAALLIHEGRLTYEGRGLWRVLELGEAWRARTGLPLPLGCNVIRRDLPADVRARASRALGRSIAFALEHRDELIARLARDPARPAELRAPALLDRYLAMYANHDTLGYDERGRRAIAVLFEEAHREGLLEFRPVVEFAS